MDVEWNWNRKILKVLKEAEWTIDGATKYGDGRAYSINLVIYDKLYDRGGRNIMIGESLFFKEY